MAGTVLGYVLAYVIQYRSFGWSIPTHAQPRFMVREPGPGDGGGGVRRRLPILRLRRTPPAASLRLDVRTDMRTLTVVALLAACLSAGPATYDHATSPRDWSFPRDHGRHDGFQIEWWYFTGTCQDAAGYRLGYELTFFRSAIAPPGPARPSPWGTTDLYFAHAAVTDVADDRFASKDGLERGRRAWRGRRTGSWTCGC